MKRIRPVICDNRARIPFSVIGIFLLIGSTFTTVYVVKLEQEKSAEIASTMDLNKVENLIRFAEADIETAINLAGMKALKNLGREPVITPYMDTGFGDTADEINKNRIRCILMDELNVYLTSNYLYDVFNDGEYAMNVVLQVGDEYPLISRDNLDVNIIEMDIKRVFAIPIIGPSETLEDQPSYYMVNVPIDFQIKRLNSDDVVLALRTVNASSIITSRHLILKSLMDDYYNTIDGGLKPLWTITTALSNVYSLIRGYKHFSSGKPLNVVDNKHLALILNGGLLLEQGLVFSSVDPLGVVEFAKKTGQTLKKTSGDQTLTDIFNDMESDGFDFDTGEFSEGSANVDAGDDINESIDDCPHVDISEIAERILYDVDSVTLVFRKPSSGVWSNITIDMTDDMQDVLNDVVKNMIAQGYIWNSTLKQLVVNLTTVDSISSIISEAYKSEMSTSVDRVGGTDLGKHAGYPDDEGFGEWDLSGSPILLGTIDKPVKGHVTPGSTVYGEIYSVRWSRLHSWSETHEDIVGNQTVNVTTYYTTTDYLNETVTIKIVLDSYSVMSNEDSWVGAKDVFYYNVLFDDINLEETVSVYIDSYLDPNRDSLVLHGEGTYYENSVDGEIKDWVYDLTWDALDTILAMIREIKLDKSITSTNYPDLFELMIKVRDDLLAKFDDNLSFYLDKTSYLNGSLYSSVGNKGVYFVRDWYVEKARDDIEQVFSSVIDVIDQKLDETLDDYSPGLNTDDVRDTLSDTKDALKNGFTIPFGFDIDVVRNIDGVNIWNETLRCAVDQYPNYLDPFEKTGFGDEEIWTMKIRNRCTLGSTGFPILPPTPVTPWILTFNIWVIDVEGEYAQFKLVDSNDETLFNTIVGHEPQAYIRESRVVSVDGVPVGENTRLSFGFTTVAFGVVPPWGMMVGDLEGDCWDEHTPGYD